MLGAHTQKGGLEELDSNPGSHGCVPSDFDD